MMWFLELQISAGSTPTGMAHCIRQRRGGAAEPSNGWWLVPKQLAGGNNINKVS